jgi:phosphoribosylglycinamide formyltransferase 1
MKIVFFCSGNGGNLKFIHLLSARFNHFEITALITDRECEVENYAKSANIKHFRHSFKRTNEEDNKLINLVHDLKPDFIVTNVHKIISENVLVNCNCSFINLHYSLLPAFAGTIGMKPVDDAIEQGCKFLGSTCHIVTKDLDLGPILSQAILPYDKELFSYDLIFKSGCLALASGLLNFSNVIDNAIQNYGPISINPGIQFSSDLISDVFDELNNINKV